jgi:hypothetical protein
LCFVFALKKCSQAQINSLIKQDELISLNSDEGAKDSSGCFSLTDRGSALHFSQQVLDIYQRFMPEDLLTTELKILKTFV